MNNHFRFDTIYLRFSIAEHRRSLILYELLYREEIEKEDFSQKLLELKSR